MKRKLPPAPEPRRSRPLKPPSNLLLAMEGRAMLEWASFALAWPLLKSAPRGDGHPVLVLPGLCAGDNTTVPLRRFLSHLGYDARPNWDGWDEVSAFLPQAEMHDLIVELRSATMGVGTFEWDFDHLSELTGKLAERVVGKKQEHPEKVPG